jgi:24-methylenesterol C-methyltransferase
MSLDGGSSPPQKLPAPTPRHTPHPTHTTAGITINQYQVDRATHHNARLGVSPLTDVVRGNFMELPFEPASFDAAYAIEATCHGASVGVL